MFNSEFYPTPEHVIYSMKLDCYNKVCYEPHAGSGNIVKYMQRNGAKQVLASEKHPQLRQIVNGLCTLIAEDFFTVKAADISHVQLIAMNPPFSNAERHILHAWEIAPEGCEIVGLMNWSSYDLKDKDSRLKILIRDYGDTPENLGDCFSEAERKTGVQVALIRLFKPIVSSSFDYSTFTMEDDAQERQEYAIMQHNDIRAVVNTYVAAVKCFDEFKSVATKLNSLTSAVKWSAGWSFNVSSKETITTQADFARAFQKQSWKYIFDKMNLNKIVTSGVMKEINQFIEARQNYPFTMRNIYRMLEIIIGTSENTMNKAIVEAVDKLTMHTHENRYGLPGWKTNAGHLLNKKFIVDYMVEPDDNGHFNVKYCSYNNNQDKITDLVKALCFISGRNYDDIYPLEQYCRYKFKLKNKTTGGYVKKDYGTYSVFSGEHYIKEWDKPKDENTYWEENRAKTGELFDWQDLFLIRAFKKGTMHFIFKHQKDWELLNRAYAKAKGQTLPEKL